MKTRSFCIGLLIIVLFVTAGCAPIATSAPMASTAGDTRGGAEPTETATASPSPTSPVSPLPTPTSPVSPLPTPTSPISPLAAPTMAQDPQGNAANSGAAPSSIDYVVRRGDTLARIASKFGVSAKAILNENPSVRSADLIYVGQHLKIPSKSQNP